MIQIIAESINDSVPSTNALFEAGDVDGVVALAKSQAADTRTAYVDVNVGTRDPAFMGDLVRAIQKQVTVTPLSIDSPDFEIAKAGLAAYDDAAGKPILNSISPLRLSLFDLLDVRSFRPILLATENLKDGEEMPCTTVEETVAAARILVEEAHKHGIANEDCIIDPGISPIGADTDGQIHRLMGSMREIHEDPFFAGVHMSVGLSNFTVMLPTVKESDGTPVKTPLANAFLTRAMPLGLDMSIASVKRRYATLKEGDPALVCFDECLQLEGFDVIMRVQEFCS